MEKSSDSMRDSYSIFLYNEVKMKKVIFLFLFGFSLVNAQYKLTGDVSVDKNIYAIMNIDQELKSEKSTLLAAGFSLVIPGAGEIYNGDYLKAGLFLAAEAVLIYLKIDYDKKGDDQTAYFQNYANQNWDPAKYARWTIKKFGINEADYPNLFDDTRTKIKSWSELNKLEDYIGKTDAGKYYSHHLAGFGEQQYYEMIGKYQQFNGGWKEFDENDMSYIYGSPLTKMFTDYSVERGKANDFYNKASTAMSIVVANHIISAVDAFFSAKSYNKKLKISVDLHNTVLGYERIYYPELKMQFRL